MRKEIQGFKMANKINYNVGFNIDKSQLNQLKAELQQLQKFSVVDFSLQNPTMSLRDVKKEVDAIHQSASQLENAFNKAFNSSLGTINLKTLQKELKSLDLDRISTSLSSAGAVGTQTFSKMSSAILSTNLQLKQSHKLLDSMALTMTNTVKWGVTSRIFNEMAGAVQDAWTFTKELDTSLNNIRIVTGKSADEMERFARVANNAAQNLGKSTKDYTDAALIYYQQGLGDVESQKRAEITLKASNVTGQSTSTVSEQLTSVWNGYKVATDEAESYVDKLAAVAADTAADLEELSIGMSKVASAANIMGVDIDQLSATLATVISVTRQAPETVGTAFKTIYARMGDINAGIDQETTLDKYTQDMKDIGGINVLDANNELRDMGDVIEEVGQKWSSMTREQQIALSQVMAGTRQYNNLLSLFDNWDMYTDALETSRGSLGELNRQQDIYMESTEAHLEKLSASWERIFDSFVDNEGVNGLIDGFTLLTNGVANFIEAIGGGGNALLTFGSIATRVFNKQLAKSINTTFQNSRIDKHNANKIDKEINSLELVRDTELKATGTVSSGTDVEIEHLKKLKENIALFDVQKIEEIRNKIQQLGAAIGEANSFAKNADAMKSFFSGGFLKDLTNVTDADIEQFFATGGKLSSSPENNVQNKKFKDIDNTITHERNLFKDIDKQSAKVGNSISKAKSVYIEAIRDMIEQTQVLADMPFLPKSMQGDLKRKVKTLENALDDIPVIVDENGNAFEDFNHIASKTMKDITTNTEDLRKKIAELSAEYQKYYQIYDQVKANGGIDKTQENYDDEVNDLKGEFENEDATGIWDEAAAEKKLQSILDITSGLTGLMSVMTAIGNLPEIWDDESLSTGEKVLQTIMALVTAGGMLFTSIKSITEGIVFLKGVRAANTAITNAETGAVAANTVAVNANKLAFMTHPIGIILVAITAVIGGILALSNAIANNTKEMIENNNATIDAKNADQELIDKNKELFDSYQDLNKAFNDGEIAISELVEAAESIIDNYDSFVSSINGVVDSNGNLVNSNGEVIEGLDLTSLKANAAARNYDALAASALKAQKELAKAGIISAGQEKDAAGSNIEKVAIQGLGRRTGDNTYTLGLSGWTNDLDPSNSAEAKALQIVSDKVNAYENQWSSGAQQGRDFTINYDARSIVQLYDELTSAKQEIEKQFNAEERSNLGVYSDLNDWLSRMDEEVTKYKQALEDTEKYSKELNSLTIQENEALGKYDGKSYEEIQQSVVNELKTMDAFKNKTDEELKSLADIQLTGISSSIDELQNNYMIIKNLLEDAKLEGLDDTGKTNLKGLSTEQLADLQTVIASTLVTDDEKNNLRDLLNSGNLDEFSTKLQEMSRRVEVASGTIGKATTNYSGLQAAKNAAEKDSTLDADEFKELNPELKQFFSLMADGTYKMTGEAEDFYKVITQLEQQDFRDILEKSANADNNVLAEEIRKAQTGLASTATATDELAAMLNTGEISSVDYEDNYKKLRQADFEELDLDEDAVDVYASQIEKSNKNIQKLRESIADTNDEVEATKQLNLDEYIDDVAVANMRLARGAETVGANWKEWNEVLKDSTDPAYAETISNMKDAVADLTNSSAEYISGDTIVEHLDDIKAAAEGDTEALWTLQQAVAQDYLVAMGVDFDDAEVANAINDVNNILQTLKPEDLQVGTVLDDADFINKLNQLAEKTGMTSQQMAEYLGSLGMDADLETHPKEVESTMQVPSYTFKLTKDGLKAEPTIESVPYTHTVNVPTIKTTAEGGSGVRVVSGGNFSSNVASAGNKRGVKKAGGGGGGKADKMDKVDKTPDRYHKVDTQLTKISNQLEKIQSQEKKLIGAALIANINGQLDKLDDRLDRLREKQQIAYGEADELRGKLAGEGVKFNDDGTIANYMEIYNAKVKYVNDLIEKYNGMSKEEQEKYKETVEQAKEDLDKFTEDLDRYDELVSDFIPGLSNEIQDAIDQEIELNIKKFNLEFDVRLNMKDATKDWNEFKKRILDGIDEDDIYGNAKARATDDFSNMIGENGVQASTKQAQEVLAELKEMDATGWSDVYGDDRAKALEDLKTAYETINEDLMEIDQIQKDVYQAWLDTMDEINDKMADQVAMYEQVSNLIDHDMKVIQLIYGETDYEALGKYYDKQHQNNLGLLDFQRQNADFWEKEMNSIDKEKDPDAWKKARDNWISAVNDLNATVEASIENARDKMENTIDDIFQKFNNEITDGKGLDYLAQQWDLVNDNADDYLDTVNAAFGIRQLENKYQDAIDLTDNISAQRKLNDLMESELKALREKDKLTEYDIERANMKYEIALKQIALEEAQQTKTTMRLRRDSQGNYRYEYIADEDAIGKLQDELDVLENSLYNFDKERWIEMQNQVVDAVQERQDAIKEIMMDASLSEEERAERLAEINRLYNEKIQNITDQTVTAQNNLYQSGADELAKIWEAEGKDFQALSNEEQRILTEEMLPQFETGVNDMITKFSGPGGFEDMTVGSMENLKKATDEYNDELDEIEYNAGVSFDKVEEGIDKNIPKTEQLIEDNDTLNQEYQEQIDKIKELNLKLQEQADKYKKIAEEAKKATQEAYNYWMEQQRQAAEAAEQEKKNSDGVQNPNEGNKNDNNPTNGGNKNPTGKTTLSASDAIGVAAAISLADNYGGWGTGATRSKRLAEKFTNDNDVQDVINRNGGYKNLKGEYNAYKNKLGDYYYSKFDTGGYTGDWAGNYGKFAMLHSKELVLNAHDTDNMLNMMQIARDVIALAGPRVGALSAGKGAGAAAGQLEQNVHIEANFPNVESASEIEEALNNLVQLASQRATRNTRG